MSRWVGCAVVCFLLHVAVAVQPSDAQLQQDGSTFLRTLGRGMMRKRERALLRSTAPEEGPFPAVDHKPTSWAAVAPKMLLNYHTSTQIFAAIQNATSNCKVPLSFEWKEDEQGKGRMFVARLGAATAKKKVLVVANEHARELLTAEVSLRFVLDACDLKPHLAGDKDTLNQAHFDRVQYVIVPIANQMGREIVETGKNLCQRTTVEEEGNVDLNRNMDVDWGRGPKQKWGPFPFSTYQTRIIRQLASEIKPLAYVDLHTGTQALMTSWGFRNFVSPDFEDQRSLLEAIKEKHCTKCRIGSNRMTIGYENPGEVIDHMYAKQGIKYSTLWELYGGDHSGECLDIFNPPRDEYDAAVNNWSGALFTLGNFMDTKVAENEKSHPDMLLRESEVVLFKTDEASQKDFTVPDDMLTT